MNQQFDDPQAVTELATFKWLSRAGELLLSSALGSGDQFPHLPIAAAEGLG